MLIRRRSGHNPPCCSVDSFFFLSFWEAVRGKKHMFLYDPAGLGGVVGWSLVGR